MDLPNIKIPAPKLPICAGLTKEQLDMELTKGITDYREGRTRSADEVFADMERLYGTERQSSVSYG